uniref:Secreted protein n=1 Tax=Anas platyrhynchos TaxID=8839 RepID=A0A8B9TUG7_ANAPL
MTLGMFTLMYFFLACWTVWPHGVGGGLHPFPADRRCLGEAVRHLPVLPDQGLSECLVGRGSGVDVAPSSPLAAGPAACAGVVAELAESLARQLGEVWRALTPCSMSS